ncbi:MAG: hypothetical protein ACXW13_00130 [Burkholderiaceae bacterium]
MSKEPIEIEDCASFICDAARPLRNVALELGRFARDDVALVEKAQRQITKAVKNLNKAYEAQR